MKITRLGSNKTVITLNSRVEVLFSYNTPVAAHVYGVGFLKTDRHYSSTTTKHVNSWAGRTAAARPQEFFDNLVK